jgi:hypothetical protein
MTTRIVFTVPDEPPKALLAVADMPESEFAEALARRMCRYFIAIERPQTAMLARNLVARTILEAIESLCQTMLTFPILQLETQPKKFVRCCYRSVWRRLLGEWQARLLCALGKSPRKTRLPRGFAPKLELRP